MENRIAEENEEVEALLTDFDLISSYGTEGEQNCESQTVSLFILSPIVEEIPIEEGKETKSNSQVVISTLECFQSRFLCSVGQEISDGEYFESRNKDDSSFEYRLDVASEDKQLFHKDEQIDELLCIQDESVQACIKFPTPLGLDDLPQTAPTRTADRDSLRVGSEEFATNELFRTAIGPSNQEDERAQQVFRTASGDPSEDICLTHKSEPSQKKQAVFNTLKEPEIPNARE